MEYHIHCNPAYALLELELEEGEKIVAQSGAMTWMSPNIQTETTTRGGIFAGLKRKVLAGESFFQNTYTAIGGRGEIGLAPGVSGAIVAHPLKGGELFLEKGAYLAGQEHVRCDAKWDGLRGLFNEGFFVLRVTGTGLLFFQAYGAIHEIQVNGEYTVDNGFAVAWEPTLQYRLTRARKIRSFLFSDQLLLKFSGQGRLWVQSRSPNAFANWIHPFRPKKSKDK